MLCPFRRHAIFSLFLLTLACRPAGQSLIDNRPLGVTEAEQIKLFNAHRQSPIKSTGRALDWAIDGPGYFKVKDSHTQQEYFTRNGAFQLDADGRVVTATGEVLQPEITIPGQGYGEPLLTEGGNVFAKHTADGQWVEMGRITLTDFSVPANLKAPSTRSGLYEAISMGGRSDFQPGGYTVGFTLSGVLEDFDQEAVATPESGCQTPHDKRVDTQNKLDWSIEGPGYFTFLNPGSGEILYARQARIKVNPNGRLISAHGYYLEPAITLPPTGKSPSSDADFVRIDADGSIWGRDDAGKELKLGSLKLALIEQPDQLRNVGFTRQTVFYSRYRQLGKVQSVTPGQAGAGSVKSGQYEDCGQDVIAKSDDYLQQVVTGGL